MKYAKEWGDYWDKSNVTLFGKICHFFRVNIISRYVSYILDKYFPKKGIFVEAGCGSGESSMRLKGYRRKYYALDISEKALEMAKKIKIFDKRIKADIFHMPFKKESIDGIWNLGVMEHFTEQEIVKILNEFYRVLKKGSYAILLWPPVFGSATIAMNSFEFIVNKILKLNIWIRPEEKTQIKSIGHIKRLLNKSKLSLHNIHFSYRVLFIHLVIVCKKIK